MENVNLKASPETRAQILQLIAIEKVANNKDYTIKSYLEMLVGLAAHGNIDQAGKLNIEVRREPMRAVATIDGQEASGVAFDELYEGLKQGKDVEVDYSIGAGTTYYMDRLVIKLTAAEAETLLATEPFDAVTCQASPIDTEYISLTVHKHLKVNADGTGTLTVYAA